MTTKTVVIETSLGNVKIAGSPAVVDEVVKRYNAHAKLLAESAVLKEQAQRMREMLKRLEWLETHKCFVANLGADVMIHRCPICKRPREYGPGHTDNCRLAALLKEMEGDQ